MIEPPAEIALKKMYHRSTMLKPRDIFDIAVTKKKIPRHPHRKPRRSCFEEERPSSACQWHPVDYLKADLAELDIQPGWEHEEETCLDSADVQKVVPDCLPVAFTYRVFA
ncbi:hypothetical protein SAMN05216337_10936 [Bradyrhizobium brasilense]|uniref:Uncharacterized protein n=2 Tax=Bradyrhizobium brasilense TaxID=1419277 RepID=A0A1G7Q920_9BRAD|nr:hypothetical protein SAMN05216337_10936 [Bradyrhizobium brasilense]